MPMTHLSRLLPILMSLPFAVHCGSAELSAGSEASQVLSVAAICADPQRLAGQTVQLEGIFQGYRAAECRFPPNARTTGKTRGDWLIQTGSDCLYVTGGTPTGIDRLDPAYLGQRIELKAEVTADPDGLLLRFIEGRPIDR